MDPKKPTHRTHYDSQPKPGTPEHLEWMEQEDERIAIEQNDQLPENFQ